MVEKREENVNLVHSVKLVFLFSFFEKEMVELQIKNKNL